MSIGITEVVKTVAILSLTSLELELGRSEDGGVKNFWNDKSANVTLSSILKLTWCSHCVPVLFRPCQNFALGNKVPFPIPNCPRVWVLVKNQREKPNI